MQTTLSLTPKLEGMVLTDEKRQKIEPLTWDADVGEILVKLSLRPQQCQLLYL